MREPDLSGVAKAWRIENTPELRARHVKEFGYEGSGLDTWLVNGPYHPFWSWWHVGVISLGDIEGAPPAAKQYPGAEYEFAIFSLDGEPDVDAVERGDLDNRGFTFLSPPDVLFQFGGVTDEQAIEISEKAVRAIVEGASCDSDFRSWWEATLTKTVEHYRRGHG